MATTSYGTDLSADRLGSYYDRVFDGTALPNATSIESSVFRFAKVQSKVELEITAKTAITIADTQSLTIELFWDEAEDGSFTNSRVINAYSASGAAINITAGTVIGIMTPETDVEHYAKVKITTTADQSSETVDGQLYYTA